MAETTVFQSGNSQAVRLPKDFRFKTKTVEIFRRGDEVVLREKPRTMGELLDSLPPVTDEMAKEITALLATVRDTSPAQERDWAALWGGDTAPVTEPASKSQTAAARRKPRK